MLSHSARISLVLVQTCTSRDTLIYHNKVQLLCAFLFMDSRQQHTTGINTHHFARRQVNNSNQSLAYQLFRLIECMDTAQNYTIGTGTILLE